MTVDTNSRFTFETFVVGPSNRLAVTACRTVSDHPGAAYNPLFIYSQTGLGKTHLLLAIGQRIQELASTLRVEYLTLDEFVEAYHAAVSAGAPDGFRQRFGAADVLLLDDIQFLSHSKEMQAELIRLASEFQEAERQLVLTSDRPPADIEALDDRLIQQLDGGLIVDIGIPEYETRLAILQRRVEESDVTFAPEVLAAIAELDVQHVRALLGIFNRLQAFQSVNEHPLTPEQARALVLGEMPVMESEAAPAPGKEEQVDEFGQFLSGLQATVSEQVEGWRHGIERAIAEWSQRGYDTASLQALLGQEVPLGADATVRAFEQKIERLRGLEAEIAEFDPEAARHSAFKSPDRLEEAEHLVREARERFVPPPRPSEAFSVETFLVGEATKVAVQAGRAVIEQPGRQYNPLMLVGASGVGKTHLLHAIGRALEARSGRNVACLAAETFVEELVNAIEQDAVPAWRARYRHASALFLDDVHQIGGRQQTQEELFNLFNLFADSGRQMVFTANAMPQEIEGLDDRLRSRLVGGLVASVSAPDPELRRAIVRTHLQARLGASDPAVVDYLAGKVSDSVRSLLNLIQRVVTGAEAMNTALDLETARRILEDAGTTEAEQPASERRGGVIVNPPGVLRSQEKIVWDWPNTTERIIEESS